MNSALRDLMDVMAPLSMCVVLHEFLHDVAG